jgi:hypothetical protein
MKTLTPEQIIALDPCEKYDLERITELFDNKKSMTYLEILDINKVPPWDIVWLFCQPGVLSINIRNQWLEVIVTRAVTNCALHCCIDKVEKWAENWLSGVDRTTKTARTTAYVDCATCAAAFTSGYADAADYYYAAQAAAALTSAAATYAVNATNYATDAAARFAFAATDAAADVSVRETEHKQQIEDLKDILFQQGEK